MQEQVIVAGSPVGTKRQVDNTLAGLLGAGAGLGAAYYIGEPLRDRFQPKPQAMLDKNAPDKKRLEAYMNYDKKRSFIRGGMFSILPITAGLLAQSLTD